MGSKKNVDMSTEATEEKVVEVEKKDDKEEKQAKKVAKLRSKKYQAVRSKVNREKLYDPQSAVSLIKKLSYSKFDGAVTAHVLVRTIGDQFDLKLPHTTGKTLRVAIVDDAVVAKIAEGTIDFDILLCEPRNISKITRYAKILGPKGLMPNPKSGTLTSNPELKKKELEGGKVSIKTEKKAPLLHINLGKVSMDEKSLLENLQALMKTVYGKALKITLAASMSPGVKVQLEK